MATPPGAVVARYEYGPRHSGAGYKFRGQGSSIRYSHRFSARGPAGRYGASRSLFRWDYRVPTP
eukprot:9943020-Lingulodinium_polyedra.AAC.1